MWMIHMGIIFPGMECLFLEATKSDTLHWRKWYSQINGRIDLLPGNLQKDLSEN